jgi:hypothetical protein
MEGQDHDADDWLVMNVLADAVQYCAGEGFGQEIQLLLQGIKTLFSFIGHINLRE